MLTGPNEELLPHLWVTDHVLDYGITEAIGSIPAGFRIEVLLRWNILACVPAFESNFNLYAEG